MVEIKNERKFARNIAVGVVSGLALQGAVLVGAGFIWKGQVDAQIDALVKITTENRRMIETERNDRRDHVKQAEDRTLSAISAISDLLKETRQDVKTLLRR